MKFGKSLSKTGAFFWFLGTFTWVILFTTVLYSAACILISALTTGYALPQHYPGLFKPQIAAKWTAAMPEPARETPSIHEDFWIRINLPYKALLFILAFSLVSGFLSGVLFDMVGFFFLPPASILKNAIWVALVVSVTFSLAFGMTFGFRPSWIKGLLFGLAMGIGVGLPGDLQKSAKGGIVFGAVFSLLLAFIGLVEVGLVHGILFGAAFFPVWLCLFFRIPLLPVYQLRMKRGVTLQKNPFIRDGVIRLSHLITRETLIAEAKRDPKQGGQFAQFLLEYRPLQHALAYRLIHAATAAEWKRFPLVPGFPKTPNLDDLDIRNWDFLKRQFWWHFMKLSRMRDFFEIREKYTPSSDWYWAVENTQRVVEQTFEDPSLPAPDSDHASGGETGVEAYESNDSPEAGEVEEVNDTGETRDTARDTTGVADTQAVENTESNPAGITENRYEALRKALSRLSSTTLRQRNAYRNDYLSAIGEWEAALETKLLTESPGTAVR